MATPPLLAVIFCYLTGDTPLIGSHFMKSRLFLTLLFVAFGLIRSQAGEPHSSNSWAGLKLLMNHHNFPTNVIVVVTNDAQREVRIWREENSWGWSSFYFTVRKHGSGKTLKIDRKHITTWTKNIPSYWSLPKGSGQVFSFNVLDGTWNIPEGVNLREAIHDVQATLHISPSVEAEKRKIFVGRITTAWQ
jgi:hypothetical protein